MVTHADVGAAAVATLLLIQILQVFLLDAKIASIP
jgi:hypothetical protein